MDSPYMSLTSIAIVVLLLLMIIAAGCHYFRPRAASWLRVNKEEKIGLSKNKLFHANGYMIYTGSDFFLSSSGSFKRFDTVDKEDFHKPNSQQPLATTNLWNLPQGETQIPPQPLRPAPAPLSASSTSHNSKSVTFSFDREYTEEQRAHPNTHAHDTYCIANDDENKIVETHFMHDNSGPINYSPIGAKPLVMGSVPQPLNAPPPPRLSSTAVATGLHNTNSIPRPIAKRMPIQQNGHAANTNPFISDTLQHQTITNTANNIPISILKPTNGTQRANENPFSDHLTPTVTSKPTSELNGTVSIARKRSISETEVDHAAATSHITNKVKELGIFKPATTGNNPFSGLTQKVKGPHMLQKTISEDYLFRKLGINHTPTMTTGSWNLSRALRRQSSATSLGPFGASMENSGSMSSIDGNALEHAISCESVTSDIDVLNCELDQPHTDITGHLCVGIKYDKSSMNGQGMEIIVKVLEARDIVCPFRVASLDTFVRIYLVPDQALALQTKIHLASASPNYNESFKFWLSKEYNRHSLWFHLYHNGSAHTLIGEAELEIGDMPNSITTWLPLSDSRNAHNTRWGELMFSLSYLPTAERLTIVVVKARNLDLSMPNDETESNVPQQEIQNVFVKVYLMNNEKKILKKRTTTRRTDRCPIFNEAMIFSMPPNSLTTVQLRLTVFGTVHSGNSSSVKALGHIIAGSCATGKGLRHWHQMLSSLRKPVAMWHILRRAANQPVFIGGAEAVEAAMKTSTALCAKRNSIF